MPALLQICSRTWVYDIPVINSKLAITQPCLELFLGFVYVIWTTLVILVRFPHKRQIPNSLPPPQSNIYATGRPPQPPPPHPVTPFPWANRTVASLFAYWMTTRKTAGTAENSAYQQTILKVTSRLMSNATRKYIYLQRTAILPINI